MGQGRTASSRGKQLAFAHPSDNSTLVSPARPSVFPLGAGVARSDLDGVVAAAIGGRTKERGGYASGASLSLVGSRLGCSASTSMTRCWMRHR